jgi:hypothetical protein
MRSEDHILVNAVNSSAAESLDMRTADPTLILRLRRDQSCRRRSASDKSEDIERALKTMTMPSLLGGTYAMDDHNHPHTPMQIVGVRGGKASVIAAQVGG